MASVLTLDELTTLIENEPAGTRTRSITIERMANVDTLLNDGDVAALDVTDEHKNSGEAYSLNSIVQAYRKIIADRKVGDKVTVVTLKRAEKVVLKRV